MRPDNWENPYPDLTEEALTEKYLLRAMEEPKSNYEIFEAGADAMLEALRAKGIKSPLTNNPQGVWVFIEEE